MIQQLPDSDLLAVGQQARQPPGDGLVEHEASFADKLQNDGGDKGLRDAADPELRGRPKRCTGGEVAHTGSRSAGGAVSVLDTNDDAWDSRRDYVVECSIELGTQTVHAGGRLSRCCTGRGDAQHQARQDGRGHGKPRGDPGPLVGAGSS